MHRYRVWLYQMLHPDRLSDRPDPVDLGTANPVMLDPAAKSALEGIRVGIVRDAGRHPYCTKFARFLTTNGIAFDYLAVHGSSWMDDITQFDLIAWRPGSTIWELEEAREKIWFAEHTLGKFVYPSFDEVMFYENKLLQYATLKRLGFPVIGTFVSSDYDETLQWVAGADYPFVTKVRTSASSWDVKLVRDRIAARKIVEQVFRTGRPTAWPSHRQKNYVFFQRFIPNEGFDLRVEVIDRDNIFGYYRIVPRGEFRASGLGEVVKKHLPAEPMRIALAIAERLGFTNLSVDFLRSSADGRYYVIETSNFIAVETDMQLQVADRPGRYRCLGESGEFTFEEGRYWVQELILRRALERFAARRSGCAGLEAAGPRCEYR